MSKQVSKLIGNRWRPLLGLILDSTAAVAAERQDKNSRQLLEVVASRTGDDEIALSVVTVLKLAHGVVQAGTPERRNRRERFLNESLSGVPIQPVTAAIALRAGKIDGESQRRVFGSRFRICSSGLARLSQLIAILAVRAGEFRLLSTAVMEKQAR